jgi:hypothetical protein
MSTKVILYPKSGMIQPNHDGARPTTVTQIHFDSLSYAKFFDQALLHILEDPLQCWEIIMI